MMLIVLIVIIYLLYRSSNSGLFQKLDIKKSPELILKERYAHGEIDTPTYQNMMSVIQNK